MRICPAITAAMLLLVSSAFAGTPAADPHEAAMKFVEAAVHLDVKGAMSAFPDITGLESDFREKFFSKIEPIKEKLGEVDHYDLISEKDGGSSLKTLKYAVFYKTTFSIFTFKMYRLRDGWHLKTVGYSYGEDAEKTLWE